MSPFDPRREAQFITSVCRRHGLRLKVVRVFVTPDALLYRLRQGPSTRLRSIRSLIDDLESALAAWRLRQWANLPPQTVVRLETQPLAFEVNHPQPRPLYWRRRPRNGEPFTCVLGQTYTPAPQFLRLHLPTQPHVLIAGATGSGKTTLLQGMILSLAAATPPDRLHICLIDLKGGDDLRPLAALPHVPGHACASSVPEAVALIETVHTQMQAASRRAAILLVVDELADLALLGGKEGARAQRLLANVAQKGRAKRVHLWLATQYPSAEVLNTFARANLPVRLVGAVASATEARVAVGLPASGAERLPGHGAFLLRHGRELRRFTAFYLPPTEMPVEVARIQRRWRHAVLPPTMPLPSSPAPTLSSTPPAVVPPALLPVFERYATSDGALQRGGLAAALRALYGDDAPRGGPPFYKARQQIERHLLTYLQLTAPSAAKILPFRSRAATK